MHDVIIIGAGPAGLSAALWCEELGLDALVLEQHEQTGGQLHSIYGAVENYPGIKAKNGEDFFGQFSERVADSEFDVWTKVEIERVDLHTKRVQLRSGESLQSIALIIATGVSRRRLGIPGELEFAGRGILESANRDREAFAGKDICVIGGGDAAVENALILAEVCPTVTLVNRSKALRARPEFAQRLQGQHCITVFPESRVLNILGEKEVEAVQIQRREALQPFEMAVQGVLIRIGVQPNTELFQDQLQVDAAGYVLVNSQQETNVRNVFAIGDVSNPLGPTIIGAAGAGATAAKVTAARLTRR